MRKPSRDSPPARELRPASVFALGLSLALGLSAASVDAQVAEVAQAEALFQEGKALLATGQYAQACPKLEASFRSDPATGTLLALAYCHEQEGKTASAWAEYLDTAARSKAENRPDRERKARERASALAPTLSRLSLRVGPTTAALRGLRVTRNGVVIDAGAFDTLLPVDPGEHRIEVSAPDHVTWSAVVVVRNDAGSHELAIPPLQPTASPPPPSASASVGVPPPRIPHAVAPTPSRPEPPSTSALPVAGAIVGAVGLLGIGVGAWYGLQAKSKNDASAVNCSANTCNPMGTQDRNDALDAARVSTIGFGAGIALLSAGTAMFLLAPEPNRAELSANAARGNVGLTLRGNF